MKSLTTGLASNNVQRTRTSVHAEQPPEQNSCSATTNIRSAFMDSSAHMPNVVQVHRTPEQNAERRTLFSDGQTPFMASPGNAEHTKKFALTTKFVHVQRISCTLNQNICTPHFLSVPEHLKKLPLFSTSKA